jgi:hypothetical protein
MLGGGIGHLATAQTFLVGSDFVSCELEQLQLLLLLLLLLL